MAVRQKFLENVNISSLPASQLQPGQKVFKKSYAAGRRDLEHEFGKSMRYKSIRDLAAGDTGQVIQDLKPIWLMSPLSVSDTLPLDPDLFDVVIFDEASQIPLEESIPAIYRSIRPSWWVMRCSCRRPRFLPAPAPRTKASSSRRRASALKWIWIPTVS